MKLSEQQLSRAAIRFKRMKDNEVVKYLNDKNIRDYFYKGELRGGLKYGYGELHWGNGNYYYGRFVCSKCTTAIGKIMFKDGRQFIGYTKYGTYKFDYGLLKDFKGNIFIRAYLVKSRTSLQYREVGMQVKNSILTDGYFNGDYPNGLSCKYETLLGKFTFGNFIDGKVIGKFLTVDVEGNYTFGSQEVTGETIIKKVFNKYNKEYLSKVFIRKHNYVIFCNLNKDGYQGIGWEYKFGEYVFKGRYRNGKKNGLGLIKYCNGNLYDGNFRDGNFNGQGYYVDLEVGKYTGNFENNLKDGEGELTLKDGIIYKGSFYENKFHGLGTITDIYNALTIKAKFFNDELVEVLEVKVKSDSWASNSGYNYVKNNFGTFLMDCISDKDLFSGTAFLKINNTSKFYYFKEGLIVRSVPELDYLLG